MFWGSVLFGSLISLSENVIMKFLVSTIGDPYSASTYSGVPYQLFQEMDKRDLIASRVNGYQINKLDYLSGFFDLKKSLMLRKPYRNAFWRYRPDTIKKMSDRLDNISRNIDYDVFFQIGCGGMPSRNCLKVAHVEIPLELAMSDKVFSKSYGFYGVSDQTVRRALEGERYFYDNCDLIWTNTDWTAEALVKSGVKENKILIFPPCVNRYTVKKELTSKLFDEPRILFIGKDWKRKGGEALLEAFSILQTKYSSASLDIVGCSPDVSIPNVQVHGFIDKNSNEGASKLEELFNKANLFCMPSTWESTGIVYFEAMQKGLPVVMVEGQGREAIFGDYSIVLKNASAEAIVNGIESAFSNPSELNEMRIQAYNIVNDKYNYQNFVDVLMNRIESIN